MNLNDIEESSPKKVALTYENVANRVKRHVIAAGLEPLFGMPGVFVTGSRVWKTVLMEPQAEDADVDIMVADHKLSTVDETRDDIVERLHLADSSFLTSPSMSEGRVRAIMPGKKYIHPNGLVVDIWGMEEVHRALQEYPEDTHASARMAWDCEHSCLLVYPNTLAGQ
jgi:hypothetical protein